MSDSFPWSGQQSQDQPWQSDPTPASDVGRQQEPLLVSIGDIAVTRSWVLTPSGNRPVGHVQWSFTDMSRTNEGIPTWAIVCTVLFFVFCFLGLLFLLAKETRTEGHVQVIVQGPRLAHTTQLPVFSLAQVADYNARVNYARSVSVAAGWNGQG